MVEKVETLLLLLGLVGVLAVLAERLRFPFPILLVVAGVVIAFVPALPDVTLDPDLVLVVFLPPLLFAAGHRFPWEDFRANLNQILALAIGLVLATMTGVAFAAHWLIPGMTLATGFVLGAIISPPDAVAATAVLKNVRVPRRLVSVLEGESLVNDSSGLVTYQFAVVAVVTGVFSIRDACVDFVGMSLGGVGVGLVVGVVMARVHKALKDPAVVITLMILTPYVAYLTAEKLHASAVLSTVTAALYLGNRSWKMMSAESRLQSATIWRFIEYLLNGVVFILIGLQFPAIMAQLKSTPLWMLLIWGAFISGVTIFIRFVYVIGLAGIQQRLLRLRGAREEKISPGALVVASWTGMRGVVSLAAALAIPSLTASGEPFPQKHLILFLTFSVIFVTLVLQGLSLPWLARKLGVVERSSDHEVEALARQELMQDFLAAIEHEEAKGTNSRLSRRSLLIMRELYESKLERLKERMEAAPAEKRDIEAEHAFYCHLMDKSRHELQRMRTAGRITEDIRSRIEHDLDTEQHRYNSALKWQGE